MSPERIIVDEAGDESLVGQHVARYEFAKQYVNGKRVVDIACGTGYGSAILLQGQPREVVGIDASAEAIKYAQDHYAAAGIIFKRGSIETLLQCKDVDLVVSFETIEHLQTSELFLAAVASLIGKHGMAILSTPVRQRGTLLDKPDNPFHIREWSIPEFRMHLSEYFDGCEILYQYVYRKRWFPGSRRLARSLTRFMYAEGSRRFEDFVVRDSPPRISRRLIAEGYIVAVCRGAVGKNNPRVASDAGQMV